MIGSPLGKPMSALRHANSSQDELARTNRRVSPRCPAQSVALQVTLERSTYDLLCRAQQLLGHQVPSGDVPQVLHRALKGLVETLEKRTFAATSRPRACRQTPAAGSRHVPAAVKRAVWERDGGQCTFVSDTGHRCQARALLEFDHVLEFARGGQATIEGMRLRCRGHNQYTAECAFGGGFMSEKRDQARRTVEARRAWIAAPKTHAHPESVQISGPAAAEEVAAREEAHEQAMDVLAALRGLGYRAQEARRAVDVTETPHSVTLEERMRAALKFLGRTQVAMRGAGG